MHEGPVAACYEAGVRATTSIPVPYEAEEAAWDLVCCRDDVRRDVLR